MPDKVRLADKLGLFHTHWDPKVVADLNNQQVKLVKILGEFTWHSHAGEDEMFLVLDGEFDMQFRDRTVTLRAGEFIVVPRGVEHRPVAARECAILLFEPATTVNTGAVRDTRTRLNLERL